MDITKNKIRPFFHIQNFRDGVEDAITHAGGGGSDGGKNTKGRSSEYTEGYDFGIALLLLLLQQKT